MISGFVRVLAAIVSSFALLWVGIAAGLWWDRRPAGVPAVHFRVLFWPVSLSAPASLKAQLLAAQAQVARDREVSAAAVKAQSASSARIAAQDQAAQVRIVTQTRTLIREIPTYVAPQADARCVVPLGFVRLHDAAILPPAGQGAAGLDGGPGLTAAPSAAAGWDADSGLKLSQVAGTVTVNYGTCLGWRQQLLDLQQWEREREAIATH